MQPVQRPLLAINLRVASAMMFATLLMLVKYAGEHGIALPEIMFWRQAVAVPLILGYLWINGSLYRLKTQRLASHAKRAGVGMTNMIFNFGAAILLPLAESTTFGFTTPLFAVVLAALVMHETVGPWRWAAVILGFLGVIIMVQPGGEPISTLGTVAALTAAFVIAIINYQIRDLGRTEEPLTIVFYFSMFGSLLAGLFLPFFITAHSLWQWAILIAIGLIGTVAQFLLAASLRYGSVSTIIVMDYTALFWATLYGWLVWDRLPPYTTWFGAPLIIAAGLLIGWREHRLSRRPSPKSTLEAD